MIGDSGCLSLEHNLSIVVSVGTTCLLFCVIGRCGCHIFQGRLHCRCHFIVWHCFFCFVPIICAFHTMKHIYEQIDSWTHSYSNVELRCCTRNSEVYSGLRVSARFHCYSYRLSCSFSQAFISCPRMFDLKLCRAIMSRLESNLQELFCIALHCFVALVLYLSHAD